MNDADDKLEKIFIDLPNHAVTGGESIWAFRLDDGTYQIDNIPFYAYGLNYKDIVKVNARENDKKPIVEAVVVPSGHATVRVVFSKGFGKQEQKPVIEELEAMNVTIERAFENYVALDIPPEADYDVVRDRLDKLESEGILEYETCESRVDGRFDEAPDDDEDEYEN